MKEARRETAAGPSRVGELLEGFLEQSGVRLEVARQSAAADWPDRVGEAIARVTRVRSISDGAMIVEVRSSAWLMELDMMKGPILERLNEGRDEAPIGRLVFVLSPEG